MSWFNIRQAGLLIPFAFLPLSQAVGQQPALVGPPTVVAPTWVGKSIIFRDPGVKIRRNDKSGKPVELQIPHGLDRQVLKEQNGWLLVLTPDGEGWLAKSDAVLAEEAVAHFT